MKKLFTLCATMLCIIFFASIFTACDFNPKGGGGGGNDIVCTFVSKNDQTQKCTFYADKSADFKNKDEHHDRTILSYDGDPLSAGIVKVKLKAAGALYFAFKINSDGTIKGAYDENMLNNGVGDTYIRVGQSSNNQTQTDRTTQYKIEILSNNQSLNQSSVNFENGRVTLDKTKAYYGDSVTINVSAETDYCIKKVYVRSKTSYNYILYYNPFSSYDNNGRDNMDYKKYQADKTFQFRMPQNDVEIEVEFSKMPYEISINATNFERDGGTVEYWGNTWEGETVTLIVYPYYQDSRIYNYDLDSISVETSNGKKIPLTETDKPSYGKEEESDKENEKPVYDRNEHYKYFSFTMPKSNVSVNATFRKYYTVHIEEVAGATITLENDKPSAGDTVTVYLSSTSNLNSISVESRYGYGGDKIIDVTEVSTDSNGKKKFTFIMPESYVNIKAINGNEVICTWEQENNTANYYVFYVDYTVEEYINNVLSYPRGSLKYEGDPVSSGSTVKIKLPSGISRYTFNVTSNYESISAKETSSDTKFIRKGDSIVARWYQSNNARNNYYVFYADKTVGRYLSNNLETSRKLLTYDGDIRSAFYSGGEVTIKDSASGITLYTFLADGSGYIRDKIYGTEYEIYLGE